MNLMGKGPLGLKGEVLGSDPARLAAVGAMPCVICHEFGMTQNSPTEVHHCKSGRYGTRRSPDEQTIPLCHSHHNKLIAYPGDEQKIGYHNGQSTWESHYGPDVDWLSWVEERINND